MNNYNKGGCENIRRMMHEVMHEYQKRISYEIDHFSRLQHYVQDRAAIANALRPYTSYREIGELFGGLDHSTIVHYCKQHERMLQSYPSYGQKFNDAMQITRRVSDRMAIKPTIKFGSHRNLQQELMIVENTIKNLRQLSRKIQLKLAGNEKAS